MLPQSPHFRQQKLPQLWLVFWWVGPQAPLLPPHLHCPDYLGISFSSNVLILPKPSFLRMRNCPQSVFHPIYDDWLFQGSKFWRQSQKFCTLWVGVAPFLLWSALSLQTTLETGNTPTLSPTIAAGNVKVVCFSSTFAVFLLGDVDFFSCSGVLGAEVEGVGDIGCVLGTISTDRKVPQPTPTVRVHSI